MIGVFVRGVLAAIAGVLLGMMQFILGLAALAVGMLAVPLLFFGALTGVVLLLNIAAWVFRAVGLL